MARRLRVLRWLAKGASLVGPERREPIHLPVPPRGEVVVSIQTVRKLCRDRLSVEKWLSPYAPGLLRVISVEAGIVRAASGDWQGGAVRTDAGVAPVSRRSAALFSSLSSLACVKLRFALFTALMRVPLTAKRSRP